MNRQPWMLRYQKRLMHAWLWDSPTLIIPQSLGGSWLKWKWGPATQMANDGAQTHAFCILKEQACSCLFCPLYLRSLMTHTNLTRKLAVRTVGSHAGASMHFWIAIFYSELELCETFIPTPLRLIGQLLFMTVMASYIQYV